MKFKSKKEAENYWRKLGWNIIQPELIIDRAKCKHKWVKIGENDYQCKKCRQGFIGKIKNNYA